MNDPRSENTLVCVCWVFGHALIAPIIAADSPHKAESLSFYLCLNTAAGTSSFKWDPSTGLDFLTQVSDQHGSHQSAWVKVPIRNWTSLLSTSHCYHPSLCLLGEP